MLCVLFLLSQYEKKIFTKKRNSFTNRYKKFMLRGEKKTNLEIIKWNWTYKIRARRFRREKRLFLTHFICTLNFWGGRIFFPLEVVQSIGKSLLTFRILLEKFIGWYSKSYGMKVSEKLHEQIVKSARKNRWCQVYLLCILQRKSEDF